MTLAQAVAAPRVHHNGLPDVVGWEPAGLSPQVRAELKAMGYAAVEGTRVHGNGECDPRDTAGARGRARPPGGRRCGRLVATDCYSDESAGAVATGSSPSSVEFAPAGSSAIRRTGPGSTPTTLRDGLEDRRRTPCHCSTGPGTSRTASTMTKRATPKPAAMRTCFCQCAWFMTRRCRRIASDHTRAVSAEQHRGRGTGTRQQELAARTPVRQRPSPTHGDERGHHEVLAKPRAAVANAAGECPQPDPGTLGQDQRDRDHERVQGPVRPRHREVADRGAAERRGGPQRPTGPAGAPAKRPPAAARAR